MLKLKRYCENNREDKCTDANRPGDYNRRYGLNFLFTDFTFAVDFCKPSFHFKRVVGKENRRAVENNHHHKVGEE